MKDPIKGTIEGKGGNVAKRSEMGIPYGLFFNIFNGKIYKNRLLLVQLRHHTFFKKRKMTYTMFSWLIQDERIYYNIISYTLMRKYVDYQEKNTITRDDYTTTISSC